MKKLIGCIVVALVTLAGSAIFAQDDGLVITDREGPSRVYGGFGIYHAEVKHAGEKVALNPIFGVLGYTYKSPDDFFADIKGSWGGGKFDGKYKYEGASSAVTMKGFKHSFDMIGRFGWMFPFGQEEEFGVTPFLGLAYFNDKDTISKNSSLINEEFYGKVTTYGYYIPVGVLVEWKVIPEFTVGLCAQINYTISTKVDPKGTKGDGSTVSGSTHKMKKAFGWAVELPMTYQLTSEWDVSLVPSYEFGKLKPKQTSSYPIHKEYKLHDYGARLEAGYSF